MTYDVLDGLLKMSVRLNDVLLPIHTVESALGRYADNLVVWNEYPEYPVSLSGSMTLLRYRSKYLALCCLHQFDGLHPPDQISLLDRDGRQCTSSGGMRSMTHTNETDYTQLVAFDFSEPCAANPLLRSRFFNLNQFPPDVPSSDVICFVCAGYPTKDQSYRVAEANAIDLVKRITVCRLGERSHQPSDQAMIELQALAPLDFDPEGMSGGSAFVVVMQHGEPVAYLGGMIMRGGRSSFQILKIGYIHRFLDLFVEQRIEQG